MSRPVTPLDKDHIQAHMCDLDLRLYILSGLPFFRSLTSEQIREINHLFVDRGYQSGEMIYFSGDEAKRLYVLADGIVKISHPAMSGKEVLLEVLKSGDFFGSLTDTKGESYPHSATAQTPVCTISIEDHQFRQILNKYPMVALEVVDIISGRLNASQKMVSLISTSSVEQRIAYVLLKLADKLGENNEVGLLIQMPLSREDLANLTALTTETVSRIMSKFQKDNLILSGRQWVAILDKEKLKSLASIY